MELNQAELLVHDDAALALFRKDHEISNAILVERPDSNKVALMVRRHKDRIPICTWLIHQDKFRFLVSPMLKDVMARYCLTFMQVSINFVRTMLTVDTLMAREGLSFSASDLLNFYIVVWPKRKPSTNLFTGNHYLRLRNK
ncbi:hypothetical protein Acr_18g0007890 [Actinidia rufa]|uniref:Uncharacterized protein n=1 Tax=Actinidia rufa TaxID=165716 RepID=A0A7J0G769_9ERIC|nr:hypothetical protein Acr_18g0007890 [Actinidia rufa]